VKIVERVGVQRERREEEKTNKRIVKSYKLSLNIISLWSEIMG
jgi:hypothetical protein